MEILILDDDPSILQAIRMLVEGFGYKALTATCAEEALELIHTHCPNLVLSDMNMPDHSGITFLESVRAACPDKDVPLVFISAMSRSQDIQSGLLAGARDYIPKPFAPDRLLQSIQTHARRDVTADLNSR